MSSTTYFLSRLRDDLHSLFIRASLSVDGLSEAPSSFRRHNKCSNHLATAPQFQKAKQSLEFIEQVRRLSEAQRVYFHDV